MPVTVTEEAVKQLPEEAKAVAAAEITQDVISEQIKAVCKAAEPETEEDFKKCV